MDFSEFCTDLGVKHELDAINIEWAFGMTYHDVTAFVQLAREQGFTVSFSLANVSAGYSYCVYLFTNETH